MTTTDTAAATAAPSPTTSGRFDAGPADMPHEHRLGRSELDGPAVVLFAGHPSQFSWNVHSPDDAWAGGQDDCQLNV